MRLCIGTTNTDKVAEIASLLAPLGIEISTLALDVEEPHETLRENAKAKAEAYCKASGLVTLSEDSGLFVDALGGMPGVWSARFYRAEYAAGSISSLYHREPAGYGSTQGWRLGRDVRQNDSRETIDRLNNEWVLALLEGTPLTKRGAYFQIALTVMHPEHGVLFEVQPSYPGYITESPRGTNGFGYDPIFVGHDTYDKTLAELDSARKNLRSHRKAALDNFYAWISQNMWMFTGGPTPFTESLPGFLERTRVR